MKFNLTTYKTLTGKKEIVELIKRKSTQAVIYKDDVASFFVDCFDLETEANVLMNSLVLCQEQSMRDVIEKIASKNNVALSVKEAPIFSIKSSFKTIELDLPPLPEEWLN